MLRLAQFAPVLALAMLLGFASGGVAIGQSVPEGALGAHREDLARMARLLGQAHHIRVACNGTEDQTWRDQMQRLLALEAPEASGLRSHMVDQFNVGYQAEARRRPDCTAESPAAEAALSRDGQVLAERMAARYLQ
jgi:uncharacterized protein (TIGR02301 family)